MFSLLSFALSCLLGLASGSAGLDGGSFSDPLRGFCIDQPEGWTAREVEDPTYGHVLSLTPPQSSGLSGVQIAVVDAGGKSARELVREKTAALAASGREGLGEFEPVDRRLAGEDCEGLRIALTQAGTTFRLEQALAVHDGLFFTVQYHAPADGFEEQASAVRAVAESFIWIERDPDRLAAEERRARLERLAARCGNEVDWAKDWQDASARSRASGKPILVVAWFLQAFALDETPLTTTFMDEDLIALANARFVPLWVTDRGALKLHRPGRGDYGMGPNTFGQALLVVSAEGEVLAETHAASKPQVAWPFLVAALGDADQTDRSVGTRVTAADMRRLVDEGRLGAAWGLGEGAVGWEVVLERARIRRLERRFGEAMELLDEALEGAEQPRLRLARAELFAEVGRLEEAQAEALAVAELAPKLRPRALLGAGVAAMGLGDRERSKVLFEELVAEHSESRWASLAALALKSSLFELDLDLGSSAPDEAALEELLRKEARAPLEASDSAVAAAGALRWLLDHQLESGAFPDGSNFGYPKALGPNPFVDAGAALAGRALLAAEAAGMEAAGEARAAARRVLEFVRGSIDEREATPPLVFYMDYMTWSDAVMLDFLADAVEFELAPLEELAPAATKLLADLAARQQDNGGWSYYKKNDLSAEDVPAQSISFTTAGVSLALSHLVRAGFEVPEGLRERSTRALVELRDPAGVFAYFLYGSGVEPHPAIADPRGDVGRGPACELALFEAGASSADRLKSALEVFLDHAPLFSSQQGKALMHAGPQGQGCHYLYFDYLHAALAASELPAEERRTTRLLDLVMDGRQADGSFLDTPVNGHSYGTAMALRALVTLNR